MSQKSLNVRRHKEVKKDLDRKCEMIGEKWFLFFLAALSLHCCTRAFSSCGKQGLFFVVEHGLLIVVASLLAEHGLQACRLQQLWLTGLVAPQHVGSSRTRAQTRVPCIGRRILNHCTTREVPGKRFFKTVCRQR